ncbi:MAG: hypothetical protein VX498_09770 [Myxococcota bacterium]|nr:hypothetical protein [Myxococcota bacterium]
MIEAETDDQVMMSGTWTESAAIELLEAALPNTTHLKPLWERIRVYRKDNACWVGLPITAKVSDEAADNHARHLYSLLNLLGVPLVPSPMALERLVVERDELAPLHYIDPRVEKEKAKAAEKERLKALEE